MTITLTLAEPAARWIDEQVAAGHYPDAAAYVADLVDRGREEAAKHVALKTAIDEGLASGISDLSFDDILREARESLVSG